MKEIKAFIHPHRTAVVIQALRESGLFDTQAGLGRCWHVVVSQVQCVQSVQDATQQHYSVELGEPVVPQTRLELVCTDEAVDTLVDLIVSTGHTGLACSGWVHVHALEKRIAIA